MNNCIEIELYNLPLSAKNRIGADSAYLDVTNTESIRLTKNVESLTVANKLQTDGVQSFSAPSNAVNDAIFVEYLTPSVVDNRREYYDIRVRIGGHSINFNRLVVRGIPQGKNGNWELELQRSPDHWIELSGTKKVNTIDFGTFELTKVNLEANWEKSKWRGEVGDVPYIWPLIDYGGWCDRTIPPNDTNIPRHKAVALEDFRPLLSLPYLLKQGFCDIGWTLDGAILESDFVAGLYLYLLSEEYYKAGSTMTVNTLQSVDFTGAGGGTFDLSGILFDTLDYSTLSEIDVSGLAWLAGLRNDLFIEYQYTFEFYGTLVNPHASNTAVFFQVAEIDPVTAVTTGEILSDNVQVILPPSGEKEVFIKLSAVLKSGQRAAMRMPEFSSEGITIKAGARGKAYPDDRSFYTNQTIDIKKAVSDENNLLDYFKAFCHLTRSVAHTDNVTKTVTLYPKKRANVFGQNVSGFILDEKPSIDLSELIVQGSEKLSIVRQEQTRFVEVGFKDSSDSYINSLGLLEQPYKKKVLNSNILPDGVTQINNPLFEPTLEGVDNLLNDGYDILGGTVEVGASVMLPRIWDNVAGQRSFRIKPRILYSYGLVKQKNPDAKNAINEYASFFFCAVPNGSNTGLIQEFGYSSMLPTRIIEPTPDFYGNVAFSKQSFGVQITAPNTDADLFSTFYLSITNELKGGFNIDLLMRLNMNTYQSSNFRSLYKIPYRGREITAQMTKIRDFAGCSGISTPVEFFIEPTESECCTLPCGCQFSTCEYYQDLGVFLQQGTLDSMTLTAFEVDGISVISSPVSFGVIKIINILGKPFIANLVDTLNSIGAPFMEFGYGLRLDSLRGARFFTVKKPVCTGFLIEISNSEGVLYRYTDALQEQSWFGTGFSALGYSTNEYTEPENCIITTEY